MRSSKQIRETGRFSAKGTDGQIYTVVESTEFVDVTTLESKGPEWLEGLKAYRLSGGGAVNRHSDLEFSIVSTGVRLTKLP